MKKKGVCKWTKRGKWGEKKKIIWRKPMQTKGEQMKNHTELSRCETVLTSEHSCCSHPYFQNLVYSRCHHNHHNHHNFHLCFIVWVTHRWLQEIIIFFTLWERFTQVLNSILALKYRLSYKDIDQKVIQMHVGELGKVLWLMTDAFLHMKGWKSFSGLSSTIPDPTNLRQCNRDFSDDDKC